MAHLHRTVRLLVSGDSVELILSERG